MPTYEYECAKCGEHVEAYQTFSEDPLKKHNQWDGATCSGALQKVFSPVGIVLKGSGFYKTDSRDSSRARSKASSESKAGSDSKSDSTSDTKTETKADSKSDSKKSDSSSGSSDTKKTPAKAAKKSA